MLSAEIVDRIAVTVGNQVITESELLLDLRITAFLNQTPLDFSSAAKRVEADRLVDLALIQKEAAESHLVLIDEQQSALLAAVKARYGTDAEYQSDLARYGIRESEVAEHLRFGARAMAFSDLRFRQIAQISDEDLLAQYNKLVENQAPSNRQSFEESRTQVEDLLRGQRALDALDEWLAEQRKSLRVSYSEKVFP
jgi:hypothetical protein